MAVAEPGSFMYSLPLNLFDELRLAGSGKAASAQAAAAAASTSDAAQQPSAGVDEFHQQPSPPQQQQQQQATPKPAAAWNEAGATCIACGIGVAGPGFASAAEQRTHFRTDWHRYNVKRRLAKRPPVTEEQFDRIVEDDGEVSSISGSDTADSSSEEEDHVSGDEGEEGGAPGSSSAATAARAARRARRQREAAGKLPQLVFRFGDGPPLAVWRCLLCPDHAKPLPPDAALLPELRRVRASCARWAVLLLRGGHFAGAVFRLRLGPREKRQHGGEPFEVVAHKTFHRYVVRAKAGGKQSSKDATGKYAKSAGSALRRYNEGALARDVAELLGEWRQHLEATDLIFVHAPSSNAKLVFGAAGAAAGDRSSAAAPGERAWALDPSDGRVRRVPFVTRRPTFSELKRVLMLLGAVMAPRDGGGGPGEESEEEGERDGGAAAAAAGEGAARQEGKQQQREAASAASAAVERAPSPPRRKPDDLPPLLKAAKAGDADRVARLLASGAHDPAAADASGRTAYQLAASKEVRDAIRRAMAAAPGGWDWEAAKVPSALTDEMEAAQASKKAEKRAKQKAKEKERKESSQDRRAEAAAAAKAAMEDEIARAAAEAAAISLRANAGRGAAAAGGRGRSGSAQVRGGAAAAGPASAEAQARRREQLAAAAEARLKALQSAQQLW